MTQFVYFLRKVDDDQVKIGVTINIPKRARFIASQLGCEVEVVGVTTGGRAKEAMFHEILAEYRLEGEWFHLNKTVRDIIKPFANNKYVGMYNIRKPERRCLNEVNGRGEDRRIARSLVVKLLATLAPDETSMRGCEMVYQALSKDSDIWTRRRVRSLLNGEADRIEHREIRELAAALEQQDGRSR